MTQPTAERAIIHLPCQTCIDEGEAHGYRKAITALRDTERYSRWMVSDEAWVDESLVEHVARYLEAIAEEGK